MQTPPTPVPASLGLHCFTCATALALAAALPLAAQTSPIVDPYARVEAEAYDAESGTRTGKFAGAVG